MRDLLRAEGSADVPRAEARLSRRAAHRLRRGAQSPSHPEAGGRSSQKGRGSKPRRSSRTALLRRKVLLSIYDPISFVRVNYDAPPGDYACKGPPKKGIRQV